MLWTSTSLREGSDGGGRGVTMPMHAAAATQRYGKAR